MVVFLGEDLNSLSKHPSNRYHQFSQKLLDYAGWHASSGPDSSMLGMVYDHRPYYTIYIPKPTRLTSYESKTERGVKNCDGLWLKMVQAKN